MEMGSGIAKCLSALIAACAVALAAQAEGPDGEQLFKRQCAVCHSTQPGQVLVGPSLAGLLGRTAGEDKLFRYSPAMKSSGIVWDAETVGSFIESPRHLVPGTQMAYPGERNPDKRAAIVAYLETLQ